MCYVIITSGSLVWFLLTMITDMLIISAIVTPKWLIGPMSQSQLLNGTMRRYPSTGIYTRCKWMEGFGKGQYNCGTFDIKGLLTENYVYPLQWKVCMIFISFGFIMMTITVFLTMVSCCRQAISGKSIHNIAGALQLIASISVLISIIFHAMGWGEDRVQRLCGPDAEAFWPGDCRIGRSLYFAAASVLLCLFCAGISRKAESGNMKTRVRRRIEEGERLVCIF